LELGDHLLVDPVREKVIDVGAQVAGRLHGTVIDHGAEGTSCRPAGEEDDRNALTDPAADGDDLFRLRGDLHNLRHFDFLALFLDNFGHHDLFGSCGRRRATSGQ